MIQTVDRMYNMFLLDEKLKVPVISAWCDGCHFHVFLCRIVRAAERKPEDRELFYMIVPGRGMCHLRDINLSESEVRGILIGQGWEFDKRGKTEFLFCDQCVRPTEVTNANKEAAVLGE